MFFIGVYQSSHAVYQHLSALILYRADIRRKVQIHTPDHFDHRPSNTAWGMCGVRETRMYQNYLSKPFQSWQCLRPNGSSNRPSTVVQRAVRAENRWLSAITRINKQWFFRKSVVRTSTQPPSVVLGPVWPTSQGKCTVEIDHTSERPQKSRADMLSTTTPHCIMKLKQ